MMLVALVAAGCGPGPDRPPLAHAQSSPDALAESVLDAIARRDAVRLRELALSEDEFKVNVWPDLPAARPERNLPFGYVWGDLKQKSDTGLSRTLARYGGQRLTFVRLTFTGPTSDYRACSVRRGSLLRVRDASGTEHDLRLFGSIVARDGAYKAFSFVVD